MEYNSASYVTFTEKAVLPDAAKKTFIQGMNDATASKAITPSGFVMIK